MRIISVSIEILTGYIPDKSPELSVFNSVLKGCSEMQRSVCFTEDFVFELGGR
jgi:hypothetical protein